MSQTDNTTHLSTQGLAKRWLVSVQTVYNWISQDEDLPASIKIGGKRRWSIEDVVKWENNRKVKGGMKI